MKKFFLALVSFFFALLNFSPPYVLAMGASQMFKAPPTPPCLMVTGASRSGKTQYVKSVLPDLIARAKYTAILNTTEQLSEFCARGSRFLVNNDLADRNFTPSELVGLIAAHKHIHFEVVADSPKNFVNTYGHALMLLGEKTPKGLTVLNVIDEVQRFIPKNAVPRGLSNVLTEGAKRGIGNIMATQQLNGSAGEIIADVVRRQIRQLVVCPLTDERERRRIMQAYNLPDPITLRAPDVSNRFQGEYFYLDIFTNRAIKMTLSPNGSRRAVALSRFGKV